MKVIIGLAVLVSLVSGCSKQSTANGETKVATSAPVATSNAPLSSVNAVSLMPAKSYDGPFGLAMGIPVTVLVDDLKFTSERPNFFSGNPPKPFESVNTFYVLATKEQGLCKIIAMADVPVVNGSGDQVKSETDRLAELLEVKYGRYSKKLDFAREDVFQRNPELWFFGLGKESVVYAYSWNNDKKNSLPNDIENISLSAVSVSPNRGSVRITYEFKNFTECRAAAKKQKASNL